MFVTTINPELKNAIDQRITTPYDILSVVENPEPESKKYTHLVMVAHGNMQKDIWITVNGVESIINVPFDHMGNDEQIRWMKYLDKKNV